MVRDSRRREREAAQNARARPRQQNNDALRDVTLPGPARMANRAQELVNEPPPAYEQALQTAPQRVMPRMHLDLSQPDREGVARRHDLAGNFLVRRGQRMFV